MTLRSADYADRETELARRNDYHRNWLLFAEILPPDVTSVSVEFVRCADCGLMYFTPRPTAEDMAIKYAAIQSDRDTEAREQLSTGTDIRARRSIEIRERLEPLLFETGRVLDIGGADGHCLQAFLDDAEGFVSDYEVRDLPPGVRHVGPAPLPDELRGSFDALLMCHIVEHLVDPVAELERNVQYLRPGGSLYLEVPFGWLFEPFQTRNLLTHINFFSVPSMTRLLERVGLSTVDVRLGSVLSSSRALPVVWAHARRTEPVESAQSPSRHRVRRAGDGVALVPRLVYDNARLLVKR